jgi:dephospho-CoA kinase
LVAQQLAQQGAAVFDADNAGHDVLRLPQIEAAARRRWGEAIFGPDGRIDRARLARIVFAVGPKAETERKYLEKLTHPEIARLLQRHIMTQAATGISITILDAALLLETGWDHWCEKIVFVEAPRETRLARAKSRGWDEEDFAAREGVQESLDKKRARADVIIDNSGSPEQTQAQVERCWASLIR